MHRTDSRRMGLEHVAAGGGREASQREEAGQGEGMCLAHAASAPAERIGLPRRGRGGFSGNVLRYGVAMAGVVLAAAVTLALWQPLFSRNPVALFYAAVIVAAWYGGTGPGLLATGLAAWAIQYLLIPSFLSWHSGWHGIWHNVVQVGMFAFIATLVSSLDATRRRAMTAMACARDAAERANRAKDDFLAVLSHELRTPLTPALAASAAMESDPTLPPAARSDLQMIRRNIELEARLIDDLLDLTRITRGKLQLNPQPTDVHTLIGHVMEICRADAEGKRLTLRAELTASPAFVSADAARLHQALWNLVKNAIKFTPEAGTILVRTSRCAARPLLSSGAAAPDGAGRGDAAVAAAGALPVFDSSQQQAPGSEAMVIEVRDSGIGIAPEALPRIFDAFEQGERTNSHRFGGLGLGLAISRAIVAAHGGALTAASEGEGRGATFTLRMHCVDPPAVAAAPSPADAPLDAAGPGPVRVLVVEDHADTARMLVRLLRSSRRQVRTADSIAAAVEAAAAEPFDLLISDLGLPDGSGIDLMRRLGGRQAPFHAIALSGYGMEEDLRQTREAGFHAHLTKPIHFDALDRTIRQVMGAEAASTKPPAAAA